MATEGTLQAADPAGIERHAGHADCSRAKPSIVAIPGLPSPDAMDILSFLLSGQALLGLSVLVSLAIVVRALAGYLGEATDLRVRLQTVQQELDHLREGLPEKKQRVEEVQRLIPPLKKQLQDMQSYYAGLREIERKEEVKKEEETPDDEIQIHRPGIPGLYGNSD